MYITFRVFPIWYGQPDPLHASLFGQIAILLRVFAILEQCDDVSTFQLMHLREIIFARTMKQGQAAVAHFDEVDGRYVLHREFRISAICNTL